jgi:hypothetical protein
MGRGPAQVLTEGASRERGEEVPVGGRRSLRRALTDLRDSCALCAAALLGCAALVLVGAVASLVWTVLSGG